MRSGWRVATSGKPLASPTLTPLLWVDCTISQPSSLAVYESRMHFRWIQGLSVVLRSYLCAQFISHNSCYSTPVQGFFLHLLLLPYSQIWVEPGICRTQWCPINALSMAGSSPFLTIFHRCPAHWHRPCFCGVGILWWNQPSLAVVLSGVLWLWQYQLPALAWWKLWQP